MQAGFIADCPYCNEQIQGRWDWKKGYICVQGFCKVCDKFILEDEVNWVKKCKRD